MFKNLLFSTSILAAVSGSAFAGYNVEFGPYNMTVQTLEGSEVGTFGKFEVDVNLYHEVWGSHWTSGPQVGWHGEVLKEKRLTSNPRSGKLRIFEQLRSSSPRKRSPEMLIRYAYTAMPFQTDDGVTLDCATLELSGLYNYVRSLGHPWETEVVKNCEVWLKEADGALNQPARNLKCTILLKKNEIDDLLNRELASCKKNAKAEFDSTGEYPAEPILP